MDASAAHINYLVAQFQSNQLTESEWLEFIDLLQQDKLNGPLGKAIDAAFNQGGYTSVMDAERKRYLLEQIERRITNPPLTADLQSAETTPVHRVHLLRTAWFRYAAAAIIIFGIGTYLYVNNQKEKPSVTQTSPVPVQNDVAPGGNRATLTLADGSKIVLDSAADGVVANDGNVSIKKINNNIIYPSLREGTGVGSSEIAYNTMSTPRGGQYQLTLPDGTQVWLNAASSITYPTVFSGKTREVSISGEVYFEVAKNKKQPFIVTVGKQTIEVLGTHFNVNSYADESTLNTTLLEGSIRIKSVHTSLVLKPGQQGQLNPRNEKLSLAVQPDIEQVMAWRRGLFDFNNVQLKDAMQQLSRWYDVEVVYEGEVPKITFGGKVQRNLNLSQVLRALSTLGVKFRIEDKRLIVYK